MQDLESSWQGHNRKATRMEVTKAGRPSILAKIVVVPVVHGVEQVFAGGWEGVKEREQDTCYIGHKLTALGCNLIQLATSLFRDWEALRWILKPKGISKQVERDSKKGGKGGGGMPEPRGAEEWILSSTKRMPRQQC
jgi:hypothetical protein